MSYTLAQLQDAWQARDPDFVNMLVTLARQPDSPILLKMQTLPPKILRLKNF